MTEDVVDAILRVGFFQDRVSNVDEDEEIQSDLVVLDPDHPLMKRFQNRLKQHLVQQIEKAKLKRREVVT